jgi:hypothetical protein
MLNVKKVEVAGYEDLDDMIKEMKVYARENTIQDYNTWMTTMRKTKHSEVGDKVRFAGDIPNELAVYSRIMKFNIFQQFLISYMEFVNEGNLIGQLNISDGAKNNLDEELVGFLVNSFFDDFTDCRRSPTPPHIALIVAKLGEINA